MCLKSQNKRQALCPIQNESILSIIVVNYCNLWYPVISVRKWNVCYFFLIFCYEMKFPDALKINLPLFFSYMHYSCHTRRSKYIGLIWTTLYCNFFTPQTLHPNTTKPPNPPNPRPNRILTHTHLYVPLGCFILPKVLWSIDNPPGPNI